MLDVTQAAGDTLYLPRGWLHEALTSETDSLHITVGVNVRTWLDEARSAVERGAGRPRVPARPSTAPSRPSCRRSTARPARAARARRLVRTRRPVLDGQLSQLRALDDLTARRGSSAGTPSSPTSRGRRLSFDGRDLEFPARLADELAFLVESDEPFTAAELPGALDEAGRLVLVRRLVREGFLRRSASAA